MKLHHAISMVAVITQASAASNSKLNGWHSCPKPTVAASGGSNNQGAECATYSAPLCYPGICKAPTHVKSTIDIFVKRLPAVSDPKTASNVWVLQGGSSTSTADLESSMELIHAGLHGKVNVYTMDHHGTGRSTLLECSSPSGFVSEPSEVPACAQALEKKYGDLSSFSITSAATDVATLISNYSNGANSIVYSAGYGTVIMERLIHLSPPEVTGYVLDGVATTSGAPRDKFSYDSTYDIDFGQVGETFLALCATKSECRERFVHKSLPATLQDLITKFDENPTSKCASVVSKLNRDQSSEPASYILRWTLGNLLENAKLRTLIPPLVYRLNRCEDDDVRVFTAFFTAFNAPIPSSSDDSDSSYLFYSLIVYSEMWETPVPSIAEMTSRFTDARIANGQEYLMVPLYCAYSKEKSATCDQLGVGNYNGNGIIYKIDEYWNKRATIPPRARVLLLSSKLDPRTPHKFAKSLVTLLKGKNKELVTFEHATHQTLVSTPFGKGNETCGMKILLSYVTNNGNLELLDKSCVDEMPALNLTPPLADQHHFLSTNDPYDGEYEASLSGRTPTQKNTASATTQTEV